MEGSNKKENRLMDMIHGVVIVGESIRGISGNGKNSIKINK